MKSYIGADGQSNAFAVIKAENKRQALSYFIKEFKEQTGFKPGLPEVYTVDEYLENNCYLVFTE